MSHLFLSAFFALTSFQAFADTPLLKRTYNIRVQAGTFNCNEPILPNGHNYPVYTRLTFSLPNYDLWLSNIWTNVSDYAADVGYQGCKDFPKILRPAPLQDLIGTVTQEISERYNLNGDKTTCMRTTREDAELLVDGVKFHGVNEFLVGPMDPKNCQ